MSGYEIDAPTTRKTRNSKTVTPRQKMDTIAETEGDHQKGFQPSAKPMEIEIDFIQEETPQPTSRKHVIEYAAITKSKPAAKIPKRRTKESTGGKGRLEDILQAIHCRNSCSEIDRGKEIKN